MNTDYVIQIKTKRYRTWSYRKEKNGWSQTAPTGIVRQLSADQLLSHLLPPLAGDQPALSVTVERKKRRAGRQQLRIADKNLARPRERYNRTVRDTQ
jgi:hypothetical protein